MYWMTLWTPRAGTTYECLITGGNESDARRGGEADIERSDAEDADRDGEEGPRSS